MDPISVDIVVARDPISFDVAVWILHQSMSQWGSYISRCRSRDPIAVDVAIGILYQYRNRQSMIVIIIMSCLTEILKVVSIVLFVIFL